MAIDIISYRKNYHRACREILQKFPVKDSYSLSLVYTIPGVGNFLEIKNNPEKSFELTNRANSIAVITDCSDFPDFERINPLCGIQHAIMAVQYREFAGIDAYPIVVNTHDIDEIVQVILNLVPSFAGFDLDGFLPERPAAIEDWLNEPPYPVVYGMVLPNTHSCGKICRFAG